MTKPNTLTEIMTLKVEVNVADGGDRERHRNNAIRSVLRSLWNSHREHARIYLPDGRQVFYDPIGDDMGNHPGRDLPFVIEDDQPCLVCFKERKDPDCYRRNCQKHIFVDFNTRIADAEGECYRVGRPHLWGAAVGDEVIATDLEEIEVAATVIRVGPVDAVVKVKDASTPDE